VTVKYNTAFYNLDIIISVGYRVKSKRGTQFRIWATNVLKQHLIQGYTINDKRLKEQSANLKALQRTVQMLADLSQRKALTSDEAKGLLEAKTFIKASKRKQPTCFIWLLRIMPFQMAINASPRRCSFGSLTAIRFYIKPMAVSVLTIMLWLQLP